MKRFFFLLFFAILFTASTASGADTSTYTLLAPLPDGGSLGGQPQTQIGVNDFPKFVNNTLRLVIGVSAFVAVLMIIIGGFKYMVGEALDTKSEGRKQIWDAILGFILLLCCYLILSVINPDLLKIRLDPQKPTGTSNQETTAGYTQESFDQLNNASGVQKGTVIPIRTGTYQELENFRTQCTRVGGSASRAPSTDGTGIPWEGTSGRSNGGTLSCN